MTPDSSPDLPDADAPAASALALTALALGVPFAQLLRSSGHGLEPVATWADGWDAEAPDLAGLAATFSETPERFDVGVLAGPGVVATGCRIGDAGAVVVLEPDGAERSPESLALLRLAADALAVHLSPPRDPARELLADIAGAPGPFPIRLATALTRACDHLGLPAAALVYVSEQVWAPETIWDPAETGLFDAEAPLAERVCRSTVQADGPIGLHDAADGDVGAYLGAPVFVDGSVYGTLCFAAPAPRATPFSESERDLVMALARWTGHALEGRLAAEALATRQALLSTLYASAPIGLGTVELVEDEVSDVRFLSANRALSEMLGTAAGSADGETAEALGVPLRMRRLWTGACRRAHAGAPPRRFEFSPADGRTCAATIARISGGGEPPRYVVVVEDVTAQRAASESLREEQAGVATLLAHAPAFIATSDLDGVVTSLRGRPASEGAATIFDLFPGSVPSGAALHRALGGEPSAWTAEVSGRTFRARAVPQRDSTGHRIGLAVVGLDVTAQAAAARAAADLDARAASATELRRALVANLAHELRTPLAALLGYADLLGDGLTGDELAEAVVETSDVAARAGRRVLAAVDDLQELVLLGEERLPSAVKPSDVADVVREAVEAYQPEAHALGVTLSHTADGAGGPLLLDPRLLARAARQLVAQALQGEATRRILVQLSTGGEAVRLAVQYDGARGDEAVADEAADRLARAMGGRVERATVEGRPCSTLQLPRRPVRLVDLDAPNAAEPLPPPRATASRPASPAPDRGPLGDGGPMPAPADPAPVDPAPVESEMLDGAPQASGDGASAHVGQTLDLASLLDAADVLPRRRT